MSFTFLKASSFRPFPPSPACLPGENLDHVGRMTTAPLVLFPSWRRCLGSLAGGGHLLCSESFCFCACLRSVLSASSGSHLVVRFSSLVDALAPFRSDGCFAIVIALVHVASGGCFAVVVGCLSRCFAIFVWSLTFAPLDVVVYASRFSCRVLVRGAGCVLCLLRVVLLLFVLSLYFLICVYVFSSIFLFLVLCDFVLVKLCFAALKFCL